MSDQVLLSELCSICYNEKPKYRCPRCKIQTCSLPCYKRHQQRASCNGKRDPAQYYKKSQLATPSGIDRDYNYLKNVERTIDQAGRDTSERGIGSVAVSKYAYRATHAEGKVHQYLNANRISVTRAPRGMSRQKTNNTRSTKRDNIMWTVEWIHASGEKDIRDNCLATSSLHDLYTLLQTEKKNFTQRALAEQNHNVKSSTGKKRKRNDDSKLSHETDDLEAPLYAEKVENLTREQIPSDEVAREAEAHGPPTTDSAHQKEMAASPLQSSGEVSSNGAMQTGNDQYCRAETIPDRFFYLLKAGTPSTTKVLIPLAPQRSLTQSLQDQTVLEYPTIYVLSQPEDELPQGFMAGVEYNADHNTNEDKLQATASTTANTGSGAYATEQRGGVERSKGPAVDANRILDMLKRDISR